MKASGFLAIVAGILLIAYLLTRTKEPFVSEFLEQGNVRRTAETASSSYKQQTNHFKMTKGPEEKPDGIETPFRVNIWDSYMPV